MKGTETFIVSNDLFRDYIAKFYKRKSQLMSDKVQINELVETEKRWLRDHVVSYTFIIEEFQPNPDSIFVEMMQTGAFQASVNPSKAIVIEPNG